MFSNPFSPLQVTDVRANRTVTLKGKLEKLGRFFETPLDDLENREIERTKLIKEFSSTDLTGLVSIVTRTNLTNKEDLAKVDQIMNDAWEVDYFLLLFVAMKLEQEPLVARIKQFFEDQFVTLAPSTTAHILDRSFLTEKMEKYEALPKQHRDYLIELFLTVEVPGYQALDPEDLSEAGLPGPSNVLTNPTKAALSSMMLPNIFSYMDNHEHMDENTRKLTFDQLLKDFGANEFEQRIFPELFKILKKRAEQQLEANSPTTAAKQKKEDNVKEDVLGYMLQPSIRLNKPVHELLAFWIITHPYFVKKINPVIKDKIKNELHLYFNHQFASMVPESSSFCFINRSYYVENRLAIEALPEEAQDFIKQCLLTCPTKGHENHKENSNYTDGFFLADSDATEKIQNRVGTFNAYSMQQNMDQKMLAALVEEQLSRDPNFQFSDSMKKNMEAMLLQLTRFRKQFE